MRTGDAEDFLDTGQSFGGFVDAVGAEGVHAALKAQAAELGDIGIAGDDIAEGVVDGEHFVDTDSACVASVAAFVAADGGPHFVAWEAVHFEELGHFFGGLGLGFACFAEAAEEALGEDAVEGGADEEGFESDVDEACDGTWSVVGVEG